MTLDLLQLDLQPKQTQNRNEALKAAAPENISMGLLLKPWNMLVFLKEKQGITVKDKQS